MIFYGNYLSTSFFIRLMMKGITLKCNFSKVFRCSSENKSSSYLNVVRLTSNSFSQFFLKTYSVQRQPGIKKSKSPQSSINRFCIGVPVSMNLCNPFNFLIALNFKVLVFLIRCPSSRMMNLKAKFSNIASFFQTMLQLVMNRCGFLTFNFFWISIIFFLWSIKQI